MQQTLATGSVLSAVATDNVQVALVSVSAIPMDFLYGWVMAATFRLSEDAQRSRRKILRALPMSTTELASTTHARLGRAKMHRIFLHRLATHRQAKVPAQV